MFQRSSILPRRAVVVGTSALLAITLGSVGSLGVAAAQSGRSHPVATTSAREEPGPIHAGNTFGWYNGGGLIYDEKFVGPLAKRWVVDGPGLVRDQHGMLTLNTSTKGTVSATLERPGRAYGRWEVRLRQREFGSGAAHYRVLTELVPVTKAGEGCGEQNIGLNRFKLGSNDVNFYIRSRPDNLFQGSIKRNLGQDRWHVYAVEVTPKRISWFVDSHVIRTETRPEALTGRKFKVRFTMQSVKGKVMNRARMQMDWLRYWDLRAPDKKSTKAPLPKKTRYTLSCDDSADSGQ